MRRFDLSAAELDVVWRSADLGRMPLIIDVPSPGATRVERAALERRVWTDLVARGLADDHGVPNERLTRRLEAIARRDHSLQLRVFGADAKNAILAVRGRLAVLGVLGERFHVTAPPGVGLAATVLTLLPELPPGPGYSVSVDTAALVAAAKADAPARARDRLRRNGISGDDARTLLAMATSSVRVSQIVAETRVSGRIVRSRPVAVHDTPVGRYRVVRTVTENSDHITVTPVTTATLADALTRLLPETRRSSR